MNDLIVCGTCAGVSDASSQLAAAAAQAGRRRATPKRRSSRLGAGVLAFSAIMLAIAGGVGYMVYSGKLAETVSSHREAISGTSTYNTVITRYNALVADANALAGERKYAGALQKFREARGVASALPEVAKEVDLAQVDSIIAHYDALAAGRVPRTTEIRTVNVHAPHLLPNDDSTIAEQPAPHAEPDIGFMEKGVVTPAAVASDDNAASTPADDRSRREPKRQTQAYTVPK